MSDELIMIDDWIEELPLERKLICVQRAAVAIGLPITLNPDGSTELPEVDEEVEGWLNAAMEEEFKRMWGAEILGYLVEDGLIETDGVAENGEILYVPTEKGEAIR